jgi:hypothetical protein
MNSMRHYGNMPSVHNLVNNLNIGKEKAKLIRMLIKYGFDYVYEHINQDLFRKTIRKLAYCYSEPHRLYKILHAIDELLEGHGVECIRKDGEVALEYINMGDTYIPTIVFNHQTWTFRCCSWGDIVEKGRYD